MLLVTLLLVTAAVCRAAPNMDLQWRSVVQGTLAFTVGWVGLTALFSFYVDTFRAYGATYGTLASVAILLVWFYLTAVLLLGAEVNALLDQEHKPGAPQRHHHEQRGVAPQWTRDDSRTG